MYNLSPSKNSDFSEKDLFSKFVEEYIKTSFFLIVSLFWPLRLHFCLMVFEISEKMRIENIYKQNDPDFFIHNPQCLTNLIRINHAVFTKSNAIDNTSFKISGAVINDTYYEINEDNLKNLGNSLNLLKPPTIKRKSFRLQLETAKVDESLKFLQTEPQTEPLQKRFLEPINISGSDDLMFPGQKFQRLSEEVHNQWNSEYFDDKDEITSGFMSTYNVCFLY